MLEAVRVLLVEDNPGDVELIKELLQGSKLWLDISVAVNGEEAIDFLEKRGAFSDVETPHLMVLDLNLPRVSGMEVLKYLRGHPELCSLPVVILSSSEADHDIKQSYALGANSYVSKPVDLKQFQVAVSGIEEFWLVLAKLPGKEILDVSKEKM